jgi:hypothetical protein
MGNEQKQQRNQVRRVPSSLLAERRYRGMEPPINLYDTLHEPERSEMLDFSGVFPTITLEALPGDEEVPGEPAAKPVRRGIPRAPVVLDPRAPRPHRYYSPPRVRSRNWARSRSQLLYRRYRLPEGWPAELLQRLPRRPLEYLQELWRRDDQEWKQRVRRALWRPALQWRGSAWKLLSVGMVVNLLLLLVVVLAMASQTLPKSLAHEANSSCRWHTISGSETLYSISASYNLDAGTVAKANHLESYGDIHTGQRLCIPIGAPTVPPLPQDALVAPNTIATGPSVAGPTQFIQFALPYAESAHQQTGWPVSMILAQWALEHGWKVPGFTGYNWGNVGALPGVPRVASGGAWGAPAYFSYARTPQDGVNYYVAVAGLSYYGAVAPAARSGGSNAAARALGDSPWDAAHYTANGSPGSSLITIMQNFDLYKYDN